MDIQLSQAALSEHQDRRLDAVASELFPAYSRNRLQSWIKSGELKVNDTVQKVRYKVQAGDVITVNALMEAIHDEVPEQMPLNIVYEDDYLLVINKPADLVVHPAAGMHSGTLLNGLLYHNPGSEKLNRAGIVHRLDKDTTGLMVVAKTIEVQLALTELLKDHEVQRKYLALATGEITSGFTVKAPIGRHPTQRTKMAVVSEDKGKHATTHFRVKERFCAYTLLEAELETGRTHQIRVHLAHKRTPIFGDQAYGKRLVLPKGLDEVQTQLLRSFKRQALCAVELMFDHPVTKENMHFKTPLPEDFEAIIQTLRAVSNS